MNFAGIGLKVLGFLLGLGTSILKLFTDRSARNAQKALDQRDQAVSGMEELQRSSEARSRVERELAADPDSLRKPDAHTAPRGADGIS